MSFIDQLRPYFQSVFAVDSVWSIILRFGIWIVIALTIISSVDVARNEDRTNNLKSNLGLFLFILVLIAIAIYLTFGFIPAL